MQAQVRLAAATGDSTEINQPKVTEGVNQDGKQYPTAQ
jgi:hypothetical protein